MYADDSSVTSTATTVKDLEKKLNEDMSSVSEWCTNNHMLANASKTKTILTTTWQKRTSLPEQDRILKVTLCDTRLDNVENDKMVGVNIKNNIWENHINSVISKVNSNIPLFRSYLTVDVKKIFFNANILSHLDNCTIIWGKFTLYQQVVKNQKKNRTGNSGCKRFSNTQ